MSHSERKRNRQQKGRTPNERESLLFVFVRPRFHEEPVQRECHRSHLATLHGRHQRRDVERHEAHRKSAAAVAVAVRVGSAALFGALFVGASIVWIF